MINQYFVNTIKKFLSKFNIGILRLEDLKSISSQRQSYKCLPVFLTMKNKNIDILMRSIDYSRSSAGQDFFVLDQLNFLTNGYFVEFGACDGVAASNTFLLEKGFQWKGILAEPAKSWRSFLDGKVRSCHISYDCVWKKSGELIQFQEGAVGAFSGITALLGNASNPSGYQKPYLVKTISLNDLLDKYQAPDCIDYLSIDTEGSEYEILSALDFSRYSFRVITCEHNYGDMREMIFDLLTKNGYARVCEDISGVDDWYVLT